MSRTTVAIFATFATWLIAAIAVSPVAAEQRLALEPYAGKLRQIRVDIAGAGRRFLFDTGGGHTLISPSVAAAIGCAPQGRVVGYRMSGEKFETPICPDVVFKIGEYQPDSETVGVFDLMAFLPKELPPVDGLISLKTFEGRAITLDLAANTLVVGGVRSWRSSQSAPDAVSCRSATGTDGGDLVLFLGLKQSGLSFWFELDSGNLDNIRVAPHAAPAFGLNPADRQAAQPMTLTLAGRPYALTGRVVDIIHDGALNAAWLEQGTLSADLSAKPQCLWRPHDRLQGR